MIFRPFYYNTGCAAYVFGCGDEGIGAVVDPQESDVDAYIAFAEATGLKIDQVIDTHIHADHASGARTMAERTGASYRLHRAADVSFPFAPIDDDDEIVLGNTRLRALHTPGHTPESICLLVTDLRRGPEPWFVLTGDTLFVGAVGRPDLPGEVEKSAGELFDSLHERVLSLPDELEVYPGHFAGSACGVGMSGKPSTTIGFEKRFNPVLSFDRDAFIEAVSVVPEKPTEMERLMAVNRGRA